MATTEYINVINEQALASFQKPSEPDTTPISMDPEEQMECRRREEPPATVGFEGYLAKAFDVVQYYNFFQAAQRLDTVSSDIHELKTSLEKATQYAASVASVQIFSLPAAEYDLNQPITVILKIYADEVVSLIPDLALHGEGGNEIEAVNDLKMQLLDLYDDLREMDDDELGEEPKAWKRTLNKLISKCR